jgi:copper transport protein
MAVGSIVATSSLSFAGHSATSGWIIQVALAVHATCAAYWLGSLWPLHAVLRHTPSTRAAIVIRRFSAIAVPTVVALAICGVVITASRVDDVELALSSEYGQILLAKLILVTALLGVAAVNRLAVTPKLIQGSNIAADTLRRNIGIEIALGMAILAMTTFLVHSPPPTAAMHASHAGHRDDHEVDPRKSVAVESRGRVAVISVAPGRAGGNAITVELRGPDAGPLQLEDVQIALSHSDAGIEPLERTATPAGEGRYTLARVDLPLTGRWTVRVDALISDFEKASFEAEITID